MKRWMTLLCALLMLLSTAYAETDYCSIRQIAEETPERWTETYETKWRTVEIDVPITVPDVSACPVLKVRIGGTKVDEEKMTAFQWISDNTEYDFEVFTGTKKELDRLLLYGSNKARKYAGDFRSGEVPTIQPEDVDLSYQDALSLCLKNTSSLWNLDASQLMLSWTKVCDGIYYFKREKGESILGARADDRPGYWNFRFEQLFHGISLRSCDNGNAYDDYFDIRFAGTPAVVMAVWSEEQYSINAKIYQEEAVVYDDIPLASFADAKAAFEAEIMAGHLRTITEVRLCYIPYIDSKDDTVFWLLPVWYAEGIYTSSAKKDIQPVYDADSGLIVGYEGGVNDNMIVAYEANLGRIIDRKATSSSRRNIPKIITWEDVPQAKSE